MRPFDRKNCRIRHWRGQSRLTQLVVRNRRRALIASMGFAFGLLVGADADAQTSDVPKTGAAADGESTIRKGQGWEAAVTPHRTTPHPPPQAGRLSAPAATTTQPIVSAAEITTVGAVTKLTLAMSTPAEYQIFALPDPYRIIIDLPHVSVQLPPSAGRAARGLITAFRFGVFAADRSRIVIDTNGPAKVRHSIQQTADAKAPQRLMIEMEAIDRESFLAALPAPSSDQRNAIFEDKVVWPQMATTKPVIVIDPGHGGLDPGAVAAGDIQEKDVVLAVAKQLEAALTASGRYEVRLTRPNDIFVALNQRVAASVAAHSNLFISLHADSIADPAFAQSARGAAVYTLSERASNRAAQLSAEKENAVDALAGVDTISGDGDDQVKSILFDLMKRETQMFSNDFRSLIIDRMRQVTQLARDPGRSAAFKVLKQSHAPSVLIELGFLSNPNDARQLTSEAWQRQAAKSIAGAVDAYFAKTAAKSP